MRKPLKLSAPQTSTARGSTNVVWLDPRVHRLAALRRRIARGEQLLAAQQTRVRALRADGYDTELAESLLVNIEDAQLALFESLARHEEEEALSAPLT